MSYSNLSFKDDLLNRKTFVSNIMKVIEKWNSENQENKSIVFSLDSSWGSGKSFLLNMWKNWILSDYENKNYATAYYNAWENDDFNNPFMPLIYSLKDLKINDSDETVIRNFQERSKVFLKSCAIALLKDGVKKVIGEDTSKLIEKAIDAATDKKVEDFFDSFRTYSNQKEKFTESLQNLIPNNGKLIIFIDELDRCRPTFAVETLEIIKHYFNIENIVFVIAIDLLQLSHSISTLYGNNMDSSGYLRRFFDFNINIPSADTRKYTINLLQYYSLTHSDEFSNMVINLYDKLNLSLRDINKITNNLSIFILYYKESIDKIEYNNLIKILEIYLYFMILKYKYPSTYRILLYTEFLVYDNTPKYGNVLEKKYIVSSNVKNMVKELENGNALRIDDTLIKKYGLEYENNINVSFCQHIERTIEMFS